jgi:hypothetical protein
VTYPVVAFVVLSVAAQAGDVVAPKDFSLTIEVSSCASADVIDTTKRRYIRLSGWR